MLERFERFSLAIFEISRCWHKLAAAELEQLPAAALERALLRGVPFPDRPLHMEQADALVCIWQAFSRL